MSKCELEVRLEKGDATYARGEMVRGRVRVMPTDGVECRGLKLKVAWRTHGRGNVREAPEPIVKELFQGKWSAGRPYEYPFEFPAPGAPATYHGRYLNVDHYVTAEADIPWSSDPKAEAEILVPGHDGADYDHGPEYTAAPSGTRLHVTTNIKPSPVAKGVIAVLGLAAVGGFLFLGGWMILAVMALVIGGASFLLLKRKVAEQRLGKPLVTIQPNPAKVGDTVTVRVMFEPAAPVVLKGGTVRLLGLERVVSGSGTNATTHRHEACSLERPLPFADRRVGMGQPISVQETLTIPSDAGPTFMADDNELTWVVQVAIGIDGWPDWEAVFPLTVRPGVRSVI